MLMNGPETPSDHPKAAPQSATGPKTARVPADAPAAPTTRAVTSRRRRDREGGTKVNAEERFFLSDADGKESVPALGKECPSEPEAIIEAFRAKVTFYRVTEFQTRADIGTSGEPVLKKEALKRNNPAS
jgi:hypothetical protein